jgi:ectoine hydroxylase-related dioxygenase (phytanoyl-CoA dioxygenase family)
MPAPAHADDPRRETAMPAPFHLSDSDLARFNEAGFLIVRSLFSAEEMRELARVAAEDQSLHERAEGFADGGGGVTRASRMNTPGDDLYGRIMRCRRMVDAMERLLGGEVYHWHSKLMLKEARSGGAWEWHQDYGYWYAWNHCLYPLMAACSISIDRADSENGCLRLLEGSHLMGRIDHGAHGGQMCADPERVEQAMRRHRLVAAETEPGDAVFFHCNLLHSSAPNRSERRRWTFICCYNAARNDPFRDSHHPRYRPLAKVEDAAVLEAAARDARELEPSRFA